MSKIPLKVESLSKVIGHRQVLRNLNFEIKEKSIHGFLGPNGAGKSTTIKLITGLMLPTNGSIKLFGEELDLKTNDYKNLIGLLPEYLPLYLEMSPREYLHFIMNLHGKKMSKNREDEMIDFFDLKDVFHRPIGHLSRGFRQRIALAQAVIFDPKLIILDEPTNGLDPHSVVEFREMIKKLSESKTILFSSHVLSEVELICDEVTIIHQGEIRASGSMSDVKNKFHQGQRIQYLIKDSEEYYPTATKISVNDKNESLWEVVFQDNQDHRQEVLSFLQNRGCQILEFWTEKSDLETIFLDMTEKNK